MSLSRWPRPVPAYAELHYAPLGRRLSRVWQPWPELYLDLPWRVTRGTPLPLLLAWADGQRFPVRLRELDLLLCSPTGQLRRQHVELDLRVVSPVGGAILAQLELEEPGYWEIWGDVSLERLPGPTGATGQRLRFRNHLAPGLPEEPLRVRVDEQALPRLPGMVQGDPHVHSSATRDMVEFGPPPELLRAAAVALELDWFALTDHSYDLDDAPDDWARQDPALPVWHAQQEWIRQANATPGPFVVSGEECSVGGLGGGVLHLLLLEPPRFFHGSADGGESWRPRRPEWRLPELLEELAGQPCLPVSAHTAEQPGRAERWLLRRRAWSPREMALVPAQQILSGGTGADFRRGRARWLELLRTGQPSAVLAGSDSHGSFSLGRQLTAPLWRVGWDRERQFGGLRSSVLLPGGALKPPGDTAGDPRAGLLLAELRAGRTLLGNGPLLWFEDAAGTPRLGGLMERTGALRLRAVLPAACGPRAQVRAWAGNGQGEQLLAEWEGAAGEWEQAFADPWSGRAWLRAEVAMADGFAMTNALRPAG
ncbi:MAG: hypothetical protein WC326_00385 [Candidatus Delongbacteria bacterium]